jgi:hypothetical protein
MFSIIFTSCEKVIDIDLNSTNPLYVIEATVQDSTKIQTVKISQTVNFAQNNDVPKISGAVVSLSDEQGNTELLKEDTPGNYKTLNFEAFPGRTYTLNIKIGNQQFSAVSKMPKPVLLYDIKFGKRSFGGFGDSLQTYYVVPKFNDPAELKNNYRYYQTVNGKRDNDILVENDNISNGKPNERPIFTETKIYQGDTVSIDLLGIDEATYLYFYTLESTSGRGPNGGATPTNPPTNIKGGALGYFSAQNRQRMTKVVE